VGDLGDEMAMMFFVGEEDGLVGYRVFQGKIVSSRMMVTGILILMEVE
jgi:hypothetical protein